MSLGKPDLYIGTELMQGGKDDPRPALAGASIKWGNDERFDYDPASSLSAQFLIRGAMPSWLQLGAPVGLKDPGTAHTLFAGTLATLKAVPDDAVAGAYRVSITATSPLAELTQHKTGSIDWPDNETELNRRVKLANSMPRNWTLDGAAGFTWINQGRQRFDSENWWTLAERYARGNLQRLNDTSYYTPGVGLRKRLTITAERTNVWPGWDLNALSAGVWIPAGHGAEPPGSSGLSVLPTHAIGKEIEWEKSHADLVTDVQVSSWGLPQYDESEEWEYPMGAWFDNSALQDAYGYRQLKIETAISSYNGAAFNSWIGNVVNFWLDAESPWRPTSLQIPDSRALDTNPLLFLLSVNTRHMAAVCVPAADAAPGLIRSFVHSGTATWTGKKWTTELTLGRTL